MKTLTAINTIRKKCPKCYKCVNVDPDSKSFICGHCETDVFISHTLTDSKNYNNVGGIRLWIVKPRGRNYGYDKTIWQQFYDKGYTDYQIARSAGTHQKCVENWRKKLGLSKNERRFIVNHIKHRLANAYINATYFENEITYAGEEI